MMYGISPERSASLNFFFPVGLMRSPIRTGAQPAPIRTACVYEVITVVSLSVTGDVRQDCVAFTVRQIYSGVVPQQPPRRSAPEDAIRVMNSANCSALTSYTVLPFSVRGRPAFGLTITVTLAGLYMRGTSGAICSRPSEQCIPSARTPRPSSSAVIVSGSAPLDQIDLDQ